VRTVGEALADPHTAARDLIVTTPHPVWGEVRQVLTAARAGPPRTRNEPAPRLGQHTDAVVEEICGFDAAERRKLREKGAFGASP
jgi:crotonobetainyl-CoA:carnitine CoA-transferase CaiB-like acyl-CoA transferase